MKNVDGFDELNEMLESCISACEMEGINLHEIYMHSEPLSMLKQDIRVMGKPELLAFLNKAIWAIYGLSNNVSRHEILNDESSSVKSAINILHKKSAAYQQPFAENGKKFMQGRQEGAITERTKHIEELVKLHPKMKTKDLLNLADTKIIGENMPLGTFKNKVTKAKNTSK